MARLLIITDLFHPDLEGTPVCRLKTTPQNFLWDTWWLFSTQFFTQFLAVMGFRTNLLDNLSILARNILSEGGRHSGPLCIMA